MTWFEKRDLKSVAPYSDELGNAIIIEDPSAFIAPGSANVVFYGTNNTLFVKSGVKLAGLAIEFHGDRGSCIVSATTTTHRARWHIQVGNESHVSIGENVETEGKCYLFCGPNTSITVGDSALLGADCEIWSGPSEFIRCVNTGDLLNPPADVLVGRGVRLEHNVVVRPGVSIGERAFVGAYSHVAEDLPPSCLAGGNPAVVLHQPIHWEPSTSRGETDTSFRPGF